MSLTLQRGLLAASLVVVGAIAAEAAARTDDWIRLGVPFMHTPDYDHDLRMLDSFGTRGRPNGRYKQWHLNNFGFRGPDIARTAPAGCRRVMILGASESFGLYERDGNEYPSQLRDSLASHGCFEVINSAIAGAGLRALIRLWENYDAAFKPDVVVIYPSPSFYLGGTSVKWPGIPGKAPPDTPLPFRPRVIEHLHNVWATPDFIQMRREEQWLARDTTGKPESWFIRTPPQDRLTTFMVDLDSLVRIIKADGAQPVLMSHAMRFKYPADTGSRSLLLLGWRTLSPQVTQSAILGFETEAAERVRSYASEQQIPFVDLSHEMSGREEYFADGMHFNDHGSAIVAGLLARRIVAEPFVASTASGRSAPR